MVLVGIILVMVFTTIDLYSSKEAPPVMTLTTVMEGIEAYTEQLVISNSDSAEDALSDPSTPQYQALQWVTDRKIKDQAVYTDACVLQQYSLATLYYSTNGESAWTRSDGWLTMANECKWHGVWSAAKENQKIVPW